MILTYTENKILPKELQDVLTKYYRRDPIGLIGCRSSQINYPVCEYDILAITDNAESTLTMKIGPYFLEIIGTDKGSLDNLRNARLALTLTQLQVINDPDWTLASSINKIKGERLRKFRVVFAREQISQSLAKLGRCNESLQDGNIYDASFWLLSSGYDCFEAVVGYGGNPPAASHLVSQLKRSSELLGEHIDWHSIMGFSEASTNSVARRLQCLTLLGESCKTIVKSFPSLKDVGRLKMFGSDEFIRLARARERFLLSSHNVVEAYSYLGLEAIRALEEIHLAKYIVKDKNPSYGSILKGLSSSQSSSFRVGGDPAKMLGLTGNIGIVESRVETLRSTIKKLTDWCSRE